MRALITVAGNPVVSTPNAAGSRARVEQLDFMLAVDIYVNETTRHADVILPAPAPLAKSHYDLALYQLAVRNVANYSPPILEQRRARPSGRCSCGSPGSCRRPGPERRRRRARRPGDRDAGRTRGGRPALARRRAATPPSCSRQLEPRRGPERVLDFMLRVGPYGDGFGDRPRRAHAGPARAQPARRSTSARSTRGSPRCCARRRARSSWRPTPIVADVAAAARRAGARRANGGMVLIGRRQLRSNNSWMHNLPSAREGQGPLHAARPPRRRRAARPRGRRAARVTARPRARSRRRSRSPTRSCPAWCRSRTAGATTRRAPALGVAGEHAGREQQRARRRDAGRAAVRQRRAERDPGRGGAGSRGGHGRCRLSPSAP